MQMREILINITEVYVVDISVYRMRKKECQHIEICSCQVGWNNAVSKPYQRPNRACLLIAKSWLPASYLLPIPHSNCFKTLQYNRSSQILVSHGRKLSMQVATEFLSAAAYLSLAETAKGEECISPCSHYPWNWGCTELHQSQQDAAGTHQCAGNATCFSGGFIYSVSN